jgi:hypothetical protein
MCVVNMYSAGDSGRKQNEKGLRDEASPYRETIDINQITVIIQHETDDWNDDCCAWRSSSHVIKSYPGPPPSRAFLPDLQSSRSFWPAGRIITPPIPHSITTSRTIFSGISLGNCSELLSVLDIHELVFFGLDVSDDQSFFSIRFTGLKIALPNMALFLAGNLKRFDFI